MKTATAEWVSKAGADFDTLQRECRARRRPNYDAACFHAQQCAEKYIKGRLCEAGLSPPRTHDLVLLLDSVLPFEPIWDAYRDDLGLLSGFAVAFRYPGESANVEKAKDALRRCRRFREQARASFGLPGATRGGRRRGNSQGRPRRRSKR